MADAGSTANTFIIKTENKGGRITFIDPALVLSNHSHFTHKSKANVVQLSSTVRDEDCGTVDYGAIEVLKLDPTDPTPARQHQSGTPAPL